MADTGRIEGINRITTPKSINRVQNYSKEEIKEKIKAFNEKLQARQETHEYLSMYQNPDNLSFSELLEQATEELRQPGSEKGYILEIGKHD